MQNLSYFLGCPTPNGFETRLGDDIKSGEFFTYIIKGGPGTGKSTLMKKIAASLSEYDSAELYYCSSDPDSLDAIVFRHLGVIFVDGTSPHVFDPAYPGAREMLLDLGRFWDAEKLRDSADDIIGLCDENRRFHQRVKRYLGAIHSLGADIMSAGEGAMLKDKLNGYIKRLAAKCFPKSGRGEGRISIRQITSVTPKGIMTQKQAFSGCTGYVINDPCFAATDHILKSLSTLAASAGYDVVVSKNVFMPGTVYEHIVIEELGLAFVSGETADLDGGSVINALRFYDRELLRERRKRYIFDRSARRELTYAAVEALAKAKTVHDDLERCYIGAMDFAGIEELTDELISELKKRSI